MQCLVWCFVGRHESLRKEEQWGITWKGISSQHILLYVSTFPVLRGEVRAGVIGHCAN
jgi:hypothetical protein